MKQIPALFRLFNPDRLDNIDPNKPENEPIARVEESLRNQALVTWYEGPGRYQIEAMEKGLIGKIAAAIGHKRFTTEDRNRNLAILDEIKKELKTIDIIMFAFQEEERRREKNN